METLFLDMVRLKIETKCALCANRYPASFENLVTGTQLKGWHYYMYVHPLRKYGLEISKTFLS